MYDDRKRLFWTEVTRIYIYMYTHDHYLVERCARWQTVGKRETPIWTNSIRAIWSKWKTMLQAHIIFHEASSTDLSTYFRNFPHKYKYFHKHILNHGLYIGCVTCGFVADCDSLVSLVYHHTNGGSFIVFRSPGWHCVSFLRSEWFLALWIHHQNPFKGQRGWLHHTLANAPLSSH